MKKTINIAIILFIFSLAFLSNSCLESDKGNPVKPRVVGSWTYQQTWVTYDIKGLYVKNNNEIWVTGNGGCILKTTNGGTVWEKVNVGVNPDFPSISFYEVEVVVLDTIEVQDTIEVIETVVTRNYSWVFGCVIVNLDGANVDNILRSYDNGFSWVRAISNKKRDDDWNSISATTFCFGEYKMVNDSVICAVGGKNRGTPDDNIGIIMYSRNDGIDWEARVTGDEAFEKFNGIDFATDILGFAVGHNGSIFKTVDAGYNWEEISPIEYEKIIRNYDDTKDSTTITVAVKSFFNKIHFINSNIGIIVGEESTILATTDAGETWVPVFDPADYPGDDFSDLTFNNFHFLDKNIGWVVGNNGIIFKTVNGGNTWTIVDSYTQVDLNNVHLLDANNAFVVGGNGTIMRYRR